MCHRGSLMNFRCLRVSDGKVRKATESENRYFFVDFFSSVPLSKEWAVSCGVYLEC